MTSFGAVKIQDENVTALRHQEINQKLEVKQKTKNRKIMVKF